MSSSFFVTGGTGLVGSYLLPRLLRKFPGSTITLLLRATGADHAAERAAGIAHRLREVNGISDATERIAGIAGDVGRENCGLMAEQWRQVAATTTHIIHGAATIRFDHPIDEARSINCGGTKTMLALATDCMKGGKFERFVYIGSSSVSGQRAGHIYEHELEMGQSFLNTYEQSKNESERIVRNHFDRIPATVFRPSIIIGDSQTGHTTSFNVIYIPLRLVQKGMLTYVPGTPDTLMDLVPIDWVDDAMVHILSRSESVGNVYHITAGPERAAPLRDVVGRAIEYFDTHTPLKHRRTIDYITRAEFENRRSMMRGREEALMGQLDTLLPYVSINRLFDSRNADALLQESGIIFPRFHEYAERIFDYCVETQWGKRESRRIGGPSPQPA
jgi:thioester reductase-like protein